jgi:hypothetical protein
MARSLLSGGVNYLSPILSFHHNLVNWEETKAIYQADRALEKLLSIGEFIEFQNTIRKDNAQIFLDFGQVRICARTL